jgi:hypothetical protein
VRACARVRVALGGCKGCRRWTDGDGMGGCAQGQPENKERGPAYAYVLASEDWTSSRRQQATRAAARSRGGCPMFAA